MTLNKVLYSSNKADYQTPKWLYDKLDQEFRFDLDPCIALIIHLGQNIYLQNKPMD
jgi:hypothetical protein